MANEPATNDGWSACQAGQLREIAQNLNARDRRRDAIGTIGGVATTLVLVIAVGSIVFWAVHRPQHENMTCADCQEHFEAYHRQVVLHKAALSSDLLVRIEDHLRQCKCCRTELAKQFPDVQKHLDSALAVAGAGSVAAPLPATIHLTARLY